ncbi:MAG: metalloregulator ArsR/SmtB family transcription factor [Actinobacteria bacterium]|nr:metalloregulator ArsR/SmtB family transcription factor [Actinomycetota bacterium]
MASTSLESTSVELAAMGFSALGDPIRLRILGELTDGPRCVCELLEEIDIAANLLSYHLRVLREAGLVEASRRGRWVDYSLAPEGFDTLRSAIPAAGADA